MENKLVVAAGLFAALPGVILLLFATDSLLQVIGLVIIALGALLGVSAFFTKRVSTFAWLALILSLFTLMFGNGYLATVFGFGLGFNAPLLELFSISVVFIELSIVTASIYGAYKKYYRELEKAGYDKEESDRELGSFSNFMFIAALGVVVLSGGIFLIFEFVPQIPIDSISGLIIAMIVYFAIATYILRRPSTPKIA